MRPNMSSQVKKKALHSPESYMLSLWYPKHETENVFAHPLWLFRHAFNEDVSLLKAASLRFALVLQFTNERDSRRPSVFLSWKKNKWATSFKGHASNEYYFCVSRSVARVETIVMKICRVFGGNLSIHNWYARLTVKNKQKHRLWLNFKFALIIKGKFASCAKKIN